MNDQDKQEKKKMRKQWLYFTGALCATVLFYLIVSRFDGLKGAVNGFFTVLAPVLIGAVIAYALNPVALFLDEKVFKKLKSRKLSWILSCVISILILVGIVATTVFLLIPTFVKNVLELISKIDVYVDNVKELVSRMNLPEAAVTRIYEFLDSDLLDKLVTLVQNNMNKILDAGANVGGTILNIAIGFIFSVYFLFGKPRIKANAQKVFALVVREERYPVILSMLQRFHSIFTRYILCEVVDALIVGVANAIFMLAFRMPYVAVVSVIVAVTNLVPTFGPIVGAAFGALILVLINPWYALWFLVFTVIIQIIDGYVIKPKFYGDVMKVSPILILLFIIVMGKIFGIAGMLLAIPVAAIVEYLYKVMFIPWLSKRNETKKAERSREEEKIHEKLLNRAAGNEASENGERPAEGETAGAEAAEKAGAADGPAPSDTPGVPDTKVPDLGDGPEGLNPLASGPESQETHKKKHSFKEFFTKK
ncbi:MAG: AI-2E family transporter [Lachnospiraceae bacterium]|nr:AI-2E family transporter [Lachnospiraceae bacterium]